MKFSLIIIAIINITFSTGYAQDKAIAIGQEAPTFSLPDLNQNYVSLRDYCGEKLRKPWKNKTKHVVVLSFFATWCKPCMAEIPHLESLQTLFSDQPVKFFLIDVGEEREKVQKFVQSKNISLEILLDRYQKTAENYDALSLPRLIVIDKQGIIRKEQKGFREPDAFEKELKKIINELLSE